MLPGMDDHSGARRRWLKAAPGLVAGLLAAPALLGVAGPAGAHGDAGPVRPPLPAPRLDFRWQDGSRSTLAERLQGRVTAVQTMFTACSATCPLQGALFAAIQGLLDADDGGRDMDRRAAAPGRRQGRTLQLLSLSIDPMTDEPAELAAWLERFGAGPAWQAGAPALDQVDAMFDFLRARSDRLDRHTGQVYLFNDSAELILRSVDLPPAEQIAELMRRLA